MESEPEVADGKERAPKRVPNLPPIFSLTLNKEAFYIENDITYKWVRLDESVSEYRSYKLTELALLQNNQKT